jgi:tetrahydromethanopterin S-methyltransferase subunit G
MNNLSDDQLKKMLENAAELGAEKAIEKLTQDVYQAVGKRVVTKLWQLLGVVIVGFCVWAVKHGWFQ